MYRSEDSSQQPKTLPTDQKRSSPKTKEGAFKLKKSNEQLAVFFEAVRKRIKALEKEDKSVIQEWVGSDLPTLRQKISRDSELSIFNIINLNEKLISDELEKKPTLIIVKEQSKTGYTFELVRDEETSDIHLFINTKSKLGYGNSKDVVTNDQNNKRKVIQRGAEKELQYCFHWAAHLDQPEIYTHAVIKKVEALNKIANEHKIRKNVGELYSLVGFLGSQRKKIYKEKLLDGGTKEYVVISDSYYAPLASGDLVDWSSSSIDRGLPDIKEYGEDDFLFLLYKLIRGLAYLHSQGIVWRDLKPDNILLVLDAAGNLDLRMIDFSYSFNVNENKENITVDAGSRLYISPEADIFKHLRNWKMHELITKNPTEVERYQQGFSAEAHRLAEGFGNVFDEPVRIINSAKEVDLLMPPNKGKFFQAHQKDDVWALAILIGHLIRMPGLTLPTLGKDSVLKQILFSGYTLRKQRPTSADVLQNLEEHFKKNYQQLLPKIVKLKESEENGRKKLTKTSSDAGNPFSLTASAKKGLSSSSSLNFPSNS